MSKKRTKEQKMTARQHNVSESFKKQTDTTDSLYTYDPIFLQHDLKRTIGLSLVILVIQIGLYLWLR